MLQIANCTVALNTKSQRLVDYTCGLFEQLPTRNSVKKAIKRGELWVNGTVGQQGQWLSNGDQLTLMDSQHKTPKPYNMPIDILWQDQHLAIIHKPAGIAVNGNAYRTVENALVGQLQISTATDALKWAKPVHRLDVPTSGLLIMAKSASAHAALGQMFEQRKIQKRYLAIAIGAVPAQGVWNTPIDGHAAISNYQCLEQQQSLQSGTLSLVELQPHTGRRHQLRKHISQAGFPIVGDKEYGQADAMLSHKGLFLAAVGLQFAHPISGEPMKLSVAAPQKFNTYLQREQRRWSKYHKH